MFGLLKKFFGSSQERTVKRLRHIVAEVNACEEKYQSLSDEKVRQKTAELKKRYKEGEPLDNLLVEAFALVKNVCRRMVGTEVHVSGYNQKWDMVPYDVQILGAIALHKGYIAEMQTGEGKTLTATMPLYLNALTEKPVHLVTVNDYLARRDCEWVGTIFRFLGLKTGVLTNDTSQEKRKEIYQADIVYATASEFGFDYLRDNSMAQRKEEQVGRGQYFAIIDEVDSILIDEARTPLIISGPMAKSRQMYGELQGNAAELVRMQRDLCNKIALQAQKELGKWLTEEAFPTDKKELDALRQSCKRLWLVGRGMPQNKVLRRAKENPDLRAEIDKWDLYFHSDQTKEEKAEVIAELFIVIDEKGNEFELTDKGMNAWTSLSEGLADFVMLDLGYEYAEIEKEKALSESEKLQKKMELAEEDMKRKERAHNLRQLLRAHLLMEKDIDYIIEDDKIVIIDENTGRPQPGRRFSDGLHQAIEAKENVRIQKETQTYASITLQNYFRLYEKLAGMTGTASTEASEFKEIYKLEVLPIPTYKPSRRIDADDEIYMTEREKYQAILKEVKRVHEEGRPILLGTESVEVSEKLSRILRQNQIPHTVLNAKNHAKEAEIVADAGARGAVTVSTNMAGRGTDIKLKADVVSLGGLHVIGTTRHPSRRIDRQLRGRCARLGDPGSSIFYVSFEDPLLRLFASPRLTAMIQRFRPPEGEPISASILNHSIQTAQKRVEARNYTIRKHTLEYDDVMNKHRQEIYNFRNEILHSKDLVSEAHSILENCIRTKVNECFVSRGILGGWDVEGFCSYLTSQFPVNFDPQEFDDDLLTKEQIEEMAIQKVLKAFDLKLRSQKEKALSLYPGRDSEKVALGAIAAVIIHKVDELWQDHLLTMDYLRSEVSLRAVAQRDPLLEFKQEAFLLFDKLTFEMQSEAARGLFRVELALPSPDLFQEMLSQVSLESHRMLFDETLPFESAQSEPIASKPSPVNLPPKVGRNDLCPCQSGRKYKKCCGLLEEPA